MKVLMLSKVREVTWFAGEGGGCKALSKEVLCQRLGKISKIGI